MWARFLVELDIALLSVTPVLALIMRIPTNTCPPATPQIAAIPEGKKRKREKNKAKAGKKKENQESRCCGVQLRLLLLRLLHEPNEPNWSVSFLVSRMVCDGHGDYHRRPCSSGGQSSRVHSHHDDDHHIYPYSRILARTVAIASATTHHTISEAFSL